MTIDIYYHDFTEVDPSISWTGLCPELRGATYIDITHGQLASVRSLYDYARPDVVIALNGSPVLSLEQTRMNPSGHNIPQRFSAMVRAAELGVPSILYYPLYARRASSDPNPRYLNVRVPLAQIRMTDIYQVPSLSLFWPTDPKTLLPAAGQSAQSEIAATAGALIANAGRRAMLMNLPKVTTAIASMADAAVTYGLPRSYPPNNSVRRAYPDGLHTCPMTGLSIDPPHGVRLVATSELFVQLRHIYPQQDWQVWREAEQLLSKRNHTLIYKGTTNRSGTDSEHPWPGYLTLVDVLYAREDRSLFTHLRKVNLVYEVPIPIRTFVDRANRREPPTPTYIVDTFADILLLDGGVSIGRPIRGAGQAPIARW